MIGVHVLSLLFVQDRIGLSVFVRLNETRRVGRGILFYQDVFSPLSVLQEEEEKGFL